MTSLLGPEVRIPVLPRMAKKELWWKISWTLGFETRENRVSKFWFKSRESLDWTIGYSPWPQQKERYTLELQILVLGVGKILPTSWPCWGPHWRVCEERNKGEGTVWTKAGEHYCLLSQSQKPWLLGTRRYYGTIKGIYMPGKIQKLLSLPVILSLWNTDPWRLHQSSILYGQHLAQCLPYY